MLSSLLAPVPAPRSAAAATFVSDTGSHPPPTSGQYAYYATYGTFGPTNSGFPAIGGSFVDPVFGRTIRRLTNEVGQSSDSEIYSRNGWQNADNTVVHHRSPSGRTFINPKTGAVVRGSGIPGNFDSSFAPDDPDAWYFWDNGSPDLKKFSVSSGQTSIVHSFPGGLGSLGGSVDWIDRSGKYMVLNVGGSIRFYDRSSNTLYAGSISGSFGGGWAGISPDGNYVIVSNSGSPTQSQSHKVDHGSKSVSTSAVTYWTLCGGHADIVSASNGKTYHVSLDCNQTGALYAADVSIPQSASNVAKQLSDNKKLIQLSWSDDVHISRVSRGTLQDWAVVSVEGGDDFTSAVSGWYAFKQEILMVNVVTGELRRLAHHRSRGDLGSNYFSQPRVSSSWDGSLVFWTSNFGYSQNGYSDLYVLETGDGGGSTPPPTASLTAAFSAPASGATVSGTTTVSMSASSGSGAGYSYVLEVDGTTVSSGPASYAWNTASVADGSHTLSVTVTDSAGATATASRTVTVSNTTSTPSLTVGFTNPTSGATVSGTVTVSLTAGTSGTTTLAAATTPSYSYTVKTGTTTVYSGTNSSFSWNTTTATNGSVTLNATVTDGNGGTGSASRTVTVSNTTTTPPPTGSGDTTAPTVTITRPTGNVWTGNSIDIIATATDNVGLSKIELWGNGSAFKTVACTGTSCATGTVWWSTGALTGAAYQVVAVAYDTAGNKTLSAPRIIYKNGTSPVIASGATGGTTTPPPSTITTAFTSPAAGATMSGTVTVGMSVSGGSGDTTFTLKDGSTTLSTQTVSSATASFAWNTTTAANGGHTLTLTAVRGGATATATRSVTVSNTTTTPPPTGGDTTNPTIKITKPGNNAWTGNSLDVAATATDNVALKSIQLYGDNVLLATKSCTGTTCSTGTVWWSTKSLSSGKHTLKAVATDAAGNTASTSITINK